MTIKYGKVVCFLACFHLWGCKKDVPSTNIISNVYLEVLNTFFILYNDSHVEYIALLSNYQNCIGRVFPLLILMKKSKSTKGKEWIDVPISMLLQKKK